MKIKSIAKKICEVLSKMEPVCTPDEELKLAWTTYLYGCTDDQIERYLNMYGICYSLDLCGRYLCEQEIANYCSENNIEVYYI